MEKQKKDISILKILFVIFGSIIISVFLLFFYCVSVNAYTVPTQSSTLNNFYYHYTDTDREGFFYPFNSTVTITEEANTNMINYILTNHTFTKEKFIIMMYRSNNIIYAVYEYDEEFFLNSLQYKDYPTSRILRLINKNSNGNNVNYTATTYRFNNDFTINKVDDSVSNSAIRQLNSHQQMYLIFNLVYSSHQTYFELISNENNSYNDYDLTRCDMRTDTCSLYLYEVGDLVPLDYLQVDKNPSPPVIPEPSSFKYTFSEDVYSVVFYLKDYTNFPCSDCTLNLPFVFNGNYQYYGFNIDYFNSVFKTNPNITLDSSFYSFIPEDAVISNINMDIYYGNSSPLVYTSEPIYKLMNFSVNATCSPIIKKYLPNDNSIFNSEFYINIILEDVSNLGYLEFDKKGKIIGNEDGNKEFNIILHDGTDVNIDITDLDLSLFKISKDSSSNDFVSNFNLINNFKVPISYIFNLFSFTYEKLPSILQNALLLVFFLGIFIFLIKVVT